MKKSVRTQIQNINPLFQEILQKRKKRKLKQEAEERKLEEQQNFEKQAKYLLTKLTSTQNKKKLSELEFLTVLASCNYLNFLAKLSQNYEFKRTLGQFLLQNMAHVKQFENCKFEREGTNCLMIEIYEILQFSFHDVELFMSSMQFENLQFGIWKGKNLQKNSLYLFQVIKTMYEEDSTDLSALQEFFENETSDIIHQNIF